MKSTFERLARTVLPMLALTLSSQIAGAFSYSDGDLILVLRKENDKDIEFNIGTVSNYFGKASGTTIVVTNWDFNLVRSTFTPFTTLAGIKFVIMATTSASDPVRRSWLTDSDASGTPTDTSASKMSTLHSKIDYVGQLAQAYTATNNQQSYVVPANDPSSYSAITGSGGSDPSTLGGAAPFSVEGETPATNRFFELRINNSLNKPAALQIGSFSLSTNGRLTFVAEPRRGPRNQPHTLVTRRA